MKNAVRFLSAAMMAAVLAFGSSAPICAADVSASADSGVINFDDVVLADTDTLTLYLEGFYEKEYNWSTGGTQVEKLFTVKVKNKSDHEIMLNPGNIYINDEKCYVSMENGSIDLDAGKSGSYSFLVAKDTQPDHTALDSLNELYLLEGSFEGLNKYEDYNKNSSLEVSFSIPESVQRDSSAGAAESETNPAKAQSETSIDQVQDGTIHFDDVVLADTDTLTLYLEGFYEKEYNWSTGGTQVEKLFTVKVKNKSDHEIMLNPGNMYINDEKCYVSMENGSIDLDAGKSGSYSFLVAKDTQPDHTALDSLDDLYLLEGSFEGLNKYEDYNQNTSLEVSFSIPESVQKDSSADASGTEADSQETQSEASIDQALESALDNAGAALDTVEETEAAPKAPEKEYETLQKGSSGDTVKTLQQYLIALGYLDGAADGSYGDMTAEAVRSFQKNEGLEADGTADEETQQKLFAEKIAQVQTADYTSFDPEGANKFDESFETLYGTSGSRVSVWMMMYLTLYSKGYDIIEVGLRNQYMAANYTDRRIDIYSPASDGAIIVRYWPDTKTADVAHLVTDSSVQDLLEESRDAGVIDDYKEIPSSDIRSLVAKLN